MYKTTTWLIRGAAIVVIGTWVVPTLFPEQIARINERTQQKVRIDKIAREYKKIAGPKQLKKYCSNSCLNYGYTDFLKAIEEGKTVKVVIFAGAGESVVELKNGKKARVKMEPDLDLLELLNRYNVEIGLPNP